MRLPYLLSGCFSWLLLLSCISCTKFLDAGDPLDKVTSEFVFGNDGAATGAVLGVYFDLQKEGYGFTNGRSGIPFVCAVSADELSLKPLSPYANLYNNDDRPDFWTPLYMFVYRINAIVEGLTSSSGLTERVKRQLLGEAKFLRGFCYFYLVNLYGDIPVLLTTDYKLNALAKRDKVAEVYDKIVQDLTDAKDLLSEEFVGSDGVNISHERIRPTKWAAMALLARTFLYTGNWEQAEIFSSAIINERTKFDTVAVNNVFLKNTKETILQFQTISADGVFLNPRDANIYILENGVPDSFEHPFWLSPDFRACFEKNDLREVYWIGHDSSSTEYFFPYKYKEYLPSESTTEYLMVLRLGEQYLIRAEARIQLNNLEEGRADLNTIRHRAGLDPLNIYDKKSLLEAVLRERRIELFTEWGHRWFDLRRLGIIDEVMMQTPKLRQNSWSPFKKLYPIPVGELKLNQNLYQNEGYPSS